MTIDRAIEILNPTTNGLYPAREWLEAHRMGCQALALLRWKDADQEKPEPDEFVLVICRAQLSAHAALFDAHAIAEYDETTDRWVLDGWPEVEDVTVSHWMRLPTLPEGVEA